MNKMTDKLLIGLIIFLIFSSAAVIFILSQLQPLKPLPTEVPPSSVIQKVKEDLASQQAALSSQKQATISLVSQKNSYSLEEEIPLEVLVDATNLPIAAIQVNISYDANLTLLNEQAEEILPSFQYGPNRNLAQEKEIQIAAITKNPRQAVYLQEATVFTRILFRAQKPGLIHFDFGQETGVFIQGESENKLKSTEGLTLQIIP